MKYREYTVIPVNEGIKLVKGNEEKTVKVVDCTEFRYKLTKTRFTRAGGSVALVAWMDEDISLFECMVRKVLDFAWYKNEGNEVKKMKIRIYEMKSNETIFTGSVKKSDTLESILLKAGKVDFTKGLEKSFTTKAGKVYNYFNIVFEVI